MFPEDILQVLKLIARQVEILSRLSFRIGNSPPEMALSHVTKFPNDSATEPLVEAITARIYDYYYSSRSTIRRVDKRGEDLLTALRSSIDTNIAFEKGWQIISESESGEAVVTKLGRSRIAETKEWQVEPNGTAVLSSKQATHHLQTEYFYVYGKSIGDQYEELVDVRIYVNISAKHVCDWLSSATETLNFYRVPFTLKVPRYQFGYDRIDVAIIYLPRRFAEFAAGLVKNFTDFGNAERQAVPLFTKLVAPGISMADNPPGGFSFGLSRMRLVAVALVKQWKLGKTDEASRLNAIEAEFVEQNLVLRTPWLNAGNVDFELSNRPLTRLPQTKLGFSPLTNSHGEIATKQNNSLPNAKGAPSDYFRGRCMEASVRIGLELCRDAIWHGDKCNWLGWSIIPGSTGARPAICTMSGDFYTGTSGIAFFLAHLGKATENSQFVETAKAAMRHAVEKLKTGYWPVGAYAGLSGILLAAQSLASTLDWDEGLSIVNVLLDRLLNVRGLKWENDIVEGRAGTIRVLTQILKHSPDPIKVLEFASQLGNDLIGDAIIDGKNWSWENGLGSKPNILGYAHGTAGIALALFELFDLTGKKRFHSAALGALEFELSGYNASHVNWPDRRRIMGKSAEGARESFMTAWCSGAPGTLLALSRLNKFFSRSDLRQQIQNAITTTKRSLHGGELESASFCLCHGVAGNADILLEVSRIMDVQEFEEDVVGAAIFGLDRYYPHGDWPCGVPQGGTNPGLLLGTAGIGHFYLRLAKASVPSALLI